MKKLDSINLPDSSQESRPSDHADGNTSSLVAESAIQSEVLIRKAFERDFDEAIEMLYRWYYAPLCNHAIRYVFSREAAEDIVSEIFSAFYLQKSNAHLQGSFRAYLFASVRNRSFNYVRYEMQRNFPLDKADRVVTTDQQPDEITEYEDLYHNIEMAINALPGRQKSIYIMCRVEGKKHEEIAAELKISIKTVKEHMYRALQQIKKELRLKWPLSAIGFFFDLEQLWNQL